VVNPITIHKWVGFQPLPVTVVVYGIGLPTSTDIKQHLEVSLLDVVDEFAFIQVRMLHCQLRLGIAVLPILFWTLRSGNCRFLDTSDAFPWGDLRVPYAEPARNIKKILVWLGGWPTSMNISSLLRL
jgi:hypothetical protein